MSLAGGLSAQVGIADETTFGTGVTPTRFVEFNSETIKQTIERLESTGLRPLRRVIREKQWQPGRIANAGDIDFDVNTQGFGLFLKHMMGEIASTQPNVGSAPTVWEHLATVGAMDARSFTTQLARADSGGTIRAFTYAGCKIPKWELECDENGFLKLKLSVDAQSETSATGLAAATYASAAQPLVYTGATIKIAGVEVPIKKFSLMGDNKLAGDRYAMRGAQSQLGRQQLEGEGIREYTGKLEMEFESLTQYNLFVNGTIGEVTAFFEGPVVAAGLASALEITMPNVRFDGETPNVPGAQLLQLPLAYKAVDAEAAKGPVQLKYRTIDTTP